MGGGQRVEGGRRGARTSSAASGPCRRHPLGEVAAGQVVHDEDDVVVLVEHLAEVDDARVVRAAEDLGLPPDPQPGLGELLGRAVQRQALERDLVAVRPRGQIDHAHAAPADAGMIS